MNSWKELIRLVNGKEFSVRKVRVPSEDIEIQGDFEIPPLAKLSMEDQIFSAAFIASHGSIKKMEELFGISYPSVKNRLNLIAEKLEFVDVRVEIKKENRSRINVLDKLGQGELSVAEALEKLK